MSLKPEDRPPSGTETTLFVPEIRDYERINLEIARRLDDGFDRVILAGVDRQRLLASGLRGDWSATIVVEGDAGPELAAGLDAPNLAVVCRGGAADGAGSGLSRGTLVIRGDVGLGLGYGQQGGLILVDGSAEARAGLLQGGGTLIVLGTLGRLSGERQWDGLAIFRREGLGPHHGRGRRGGRVLLVPVAIGLDGDHEDLAILATAVAQAGEWLADPSGLLR